MNEGEPIHVLKIIIANQRAEGNAYLRAYSH